MIKRMIELLQRWFVRREIVALNRSIEVRYTAQAELMISQLNNFDREQFEREYLGIITIGDGAIWKYVLSRELTKRPRGGK